jgi:hypothetical protein
MDRVVTLVDGKVYEVSRDADPEPDMAPPLDPGEG